MADRLIIGCGYLGQRLAQRWRAAGHRVFATTRSPDHAEAFRKQGLEPIVCDVLQPASLRALPAVDLAVHCVGFDRSSGHSMHAVYVDGLGQVLAALREGVARFFHVSSTGVYGQSGGEEVDEASATEPVDDSGRVVLAAEHLLRDRLPQAVIFRFAGIYGPGRLLARAQALRAGQPLVGDGERWLNLIHVEDGAAVLQQAEERAQPGAIYNVCDDRPPRRREFYGRLADLLGAPPPSFEPLPPGLPPPARMRANRRILNRRIRQELQVELRYPCFEEGLPAALAQRG
jgi:nucleoside-diphosphate-sugar epimerase